MSDIKNVNAKIDDAEAAVKKYASKDTVISIGGYEFTPAKLMVAFTLVSSLLGGLYGSFEVYKDYQSMKKKIADYAAPDLTGFQEQISVMRVEMKKVQDSVSEARDYTRDIKNDLKTDVDRVEKVSDGTERRVKDSEDKMRAMIEIASQRFDNKRDQLSTDNDRKLKDLSTDNERKLRDLSTDNERKIKDLEDRVGRKIQSALDNPLAK
jgi:hypothetical protein